MKKIVKVVTISLDKQGFSKGDLCKCIKPLISDDKEAEICIATHTSEVSSEYWKAQQLLVLSDDEIQEGDVKHSRNCEPYKKVIASYPQIEGTLPISQEFIQQYVQSQGEGVVYMETEYTSGWAKQLVEYAGEPSYYHYKPTIDKAGNAVLSIEQEVNTQLLEDSTEIVNNEAIAFADWLLVNYVNTINNQWRKFSSDTTYTSKELYNIWQQTKKQ